MFGAENVLLCVVLHPFATSAINGPVSIGPYMLAKMTPESHGMSYPMFNDIDIVISYHIASSYSITYNYALFG